MKDQPKLFPKEGSSTNETNDIEKLENALLEQFKTIRDAIHKDVYLTQLEVLIIDTFVFQRLRGLKQLGTVNVVYHCALHTRFDHSIGCLYVADKMISIINKNTSNEIKINNFERFIIRLCALLHDLAHIPFGHTLEDEAGLFESQWNDEERIMKFLGDDSEISKIIKNYGILKDLVKKGQLQYAPENVLIQIRKIVKAIESHSAIELEKPYMADIVGDTLCADLLDYIKRDIYFTGLDENYDDRFLSYLYLDNIEIEYKGKKTKKARLILKLNKQNTKRLRRDVLSELIHLLRLRYSLAEKVYFHHAKIASSAMIISAVTSMLIENKLKLNDLYMISDDVFIQRMINGETSTLISRTIITKLLKHKLYKPIYGLKYEGDDDANKNKKSEIIDDLKVDRVRYTAERSLEKVSFLPIGSIVIYCPEKKMGSKPVEALVNIDGTNIGKLNEVASKRIQEEIKVSIINKHEELWAMYVFVDKEIIENNEKLAQQINGDCYKMFKLANGIDECEEFISQDPIPYLLRYEEKYSAEKAIKPLNHEILFETSNRNDNPIGKEKYKFSSYEEFVEYRQNIPNE